MFSSFTRFARTVFQTRPFSTVRSIQLIDNYNRKHDYLRISLTERCNLRCRYCMPEEGVELSKANECLNLDELKRLTSIFVETCGVSKIRLTGGEPTLDKKLVPLLEHLRNLRSKGLKTVAMTTNGLTLKRYSTVYKQLGVDAINISLDTLKANRFEYITRRRGLELVLAGLQSALSSGFQIVKLNCVLMRGFNEDELLDFVELASNHPIEVRFIEFMPFAGNNWTSGKLVPSCELLKLIQERYPEIERVETDKSSSSRLYKDVSMKGAIGFISSMTENFCSGCNRLRIISDGHLKVCLLGREETSLKDLMRYGASDAEIIRAVCSALSHKKKKHAGSRVISGDVYRPMVKIGARMLSTSSRIHHNFSHLDEDGRVNMVDVGSKPILKRISIAEGKIYLGRELLEKIYNQTTKKGDVVSVAKVAGIMGAKQTSLLIPLCHQIPLDSVQVDIKPCEQSESLLVTATVVARHRTGVEMESLTAVSVTLLTLYDMCKSASKSMRIEEIRLVSKLKSTEV